MDATPQTDNCMSSYIERQQHNRIPGSPSAHEMVRNGVVVVLQEFRKVEAVLLTTIKVQFYDKTFVQKNRGKRYADCIIFAWCNIRRH